MQCVSIKTQLIQIWQHTKPYSVPYNWIEFHYKCQYLSLNAPPPKEKRSFVYLFQTKGNKHD